MVRIGARLRQCLRSTRDRQLHLLLRSTDQDVVVSTAKDRVAFLQHLATAVQERHAAALHVLEVSRTNSAEAAEGVSEVRILPLAGSIFARAGRDLLRRLHELPDVLDVELDKPAQPAITCDEAVRLHPPKEMPPDGISWSLKRIGALALWDTGITGRGVTVAVVDTGVHFPHDDLRKQMWTAPGDGPPHGWNSYERSADVADTIGHGTLSAGIIAGTGAQGVCTGVAPEAKVMAIKVYGPEGSSQACVWEGLEWAVRQGADVISLSVSFRADQSPQYAAWRFACDALRAAGIPLVCSAGNLGHRVDLYPPPFNIPTPGNVPPPWLHPAQQIKGGLSGAITCGATDEQDEPVTEALNGRGGGTGRGPVTWIEISPYNDYPYGSNDSGLLKPDVCAPGQDVISLHPSGGYAVFWGTSAAVPHVAGGIALLLSAFPTTSPGVLTWALESTAVHPVPGSKDNVRGSGRISLADAHRALQGCGLPQA